MLLACVKPLGLFMARVYSGRAHYLEPVFGPLERWVYRLGGIRREQEMTWRQYSGALLTFSLIGFVAVYGSSGCKASCRSIRSRCPAVSPDSAFNTAVSFVTNTNWQGYGGETTMSYLTQMLGLTVQNFVSAATGMAVLVALIRGFVADSSRNHRQLLGRPDRGTLYILLPLSLCWP